MQNEWPSFHFVGNFVIRFFWHKREFGKFISKQQQQSKHIKFVAINLWTSSKLWPMVDLLLVIPDLCFLRLIYIYIYMPIQFYMIRDFSIKYFSFILIFENGIWYRKYVYIYFFKKTDKYRPRIKMRLSTKKRSKGEGCQYHHHLWLPF